MPAKTLSPVVKRVTLSSTLAERGRIVLYPKEPYQIASPCNAHAKGGMGVVADEAGSLSSRISVYVMRGGVFATQLAALGSR